MPPDKRVDQALAWLDLPEDRRPSFLSLYFEQVDSAGHSYGPDSPQVDEALTTVDAALGRFVADLKQRNRLDNTNLVIVSDHGMTDSSPIRTLILERVAKVNLDHIEIVSTLVILGVNPKPGFEAEVEKAMTSRPLHPTCWKKSQMPRKFRYGKSPRIAAIQCLPDSSWMVSTEAVEEKRLKPVLGEHGYATDTRCGSSEGNRLPITAIQTEGHTHPLAIVATIKAVGAVSLIRFLHGDLCRLERPPFRPDHSCIAKD